MHDSLSRAPLSFLSVLSIPEPHRTAKARDLGPADEQRLSGRGGGGAEGRSRGRETEEGSPVKNPRTTFIAENCGACRFFKRVPETFFPVDDYRDDASRAKAQCGFLFCQLQRPNSDTSEFVIRDSPVVLARDRRSIPVDLPTAMRSGRRRGRSFRKFNG
jgi:hypothetical protein